MKKLTFTWVAFSLATLALTSCGRNRITIVETSYMVTHPAAHRGDILIFEIPPPGLGKKNYVHFYPAASPCAADTISAPPGKSLQCKVVVDPPTEARYLYYIDSRPETNLRKGCPPWCTEVLVDPTPAVPGHPLAPLPPESGLYPAVEVLISNNTYGKPFSGNANAYQTQPVTWFKSGLDNTGWSVLFKDDICQEGKQITSKPAEVVYCTVKGDAAVGYHSYTITVDKTTGPPSQLYVVPPISLGIP